jgi:hypothetical protein
MRYPKYEKKDIESKSRKPGLYLGLFHGFKNEDERGKANDWGSNGPLIGPLTYVHTTYASHIHIRFPENSLDYQKYGFKDNEVDLEIDKEGCVKFGRKQYGDWTVFPIPEIK